MTLEVRGILQRYSKLFDIFSPGPCSYGEYSFLLSCEPLTVCEGLDVGATYLAWQQHRRRGQAATQADPNENCLSVHLAFLSRFRTPNDSARRKCTERSGAEKGDPHSRPRRVFKVHFQQRTELGRF
jgi:hypothetical protein